MSKKVKALALVITVVAVALVAVSAIGLPFGQFGADSKAEAAYEFCAPHLGRVRMNAVPPVDALESPGGPRVVTLPKDADHGGFDTYIVLGARVVDGTQWLALCIGSNKPVWVKSSQVYPDPGPPSNILRFDWLPGVVK